MGYGLLLVWADLTREITLKEMLPVIFEIVVTIVWFYLCVPIFFLIYPFCPRHIREPEELVFMDRVHSEVEAKWGKG